MKKKCSMCGAEFTTSVLFKHVKVHNCPKCSAINKPRKVKYPKGVEPNGYL